ncbi:MAG: OmpA family protein [Halobacteriovoraceae bacterium]|nr:OmpA family protein [Halobacteriovoraceae bacterium]
MVSFKDLVPTKKTNKKSTKLFVGKTNFSFGSTKVSVEDISNIESLKNQLKEGQIILKGFTDNIGPLHINAYIARKRAESVKTILVSLGVDSERISILSSPLSDYQNDNLNNNQRQQNRRVEIYVKTNRRIIL